MIISSTLLNYNEQKEKATIRLMLKHFRCKGYFEAFQALSKETNVELEDEKITEMYKYLVDDGDFAKVEKIMQKMIEGNSRG